MGGRRDEGRDVKLLSLWPGFAVNLQLLRACGRVSRVSGPSPLSELPSLMLSPCREMGPCSPAAPAAAFPNPTIFHDNLPWGSLPASAIQARSWGQRRDVAGTAAASPAPMPLPLCREQRGRLSSPSVDGGTD